jgi:carbon storage regulator CsrA
MLVLSRKLDEKITVFGPDGQQLMELVIVNIDHGKVRLGVKADKALAIYRNELIPHIRGEQNRRAA